MSETNEDQTGADVEVEKTNEDPEDVGVEEAPAPEEAPDAVAEKASLGVALDANQFPQVVTLVAGMVLLIALGAEYDWDFSWLPYRGYALSVSIIAMALSCGNLIALKFAKGVYDKHGSHVNILLFCYNFVGACFLTFEKPFTTTSNGYFASWALVYGSAMSLGMKQAGIGSKIRGLGSIVGLLASALVVVIATIKPVRDLGEGVYDGVKGEAIYALVLACLTFVVTSVIMVQHTE
mmetsp:Transcript_38121/g.91234  ORF Transcript_38121/g.91234 Transcript_38121/m.91234 type:complete len:236 (+) Transcript_38121:241-948(+)